MRERAGTGVPDTEVNGADDADADARDQGEALDPWPRRRWVSVGVLVVLLALVGAGVGYLLSGGSKTGAGGPEGVAIQGVPDLAPAGTTASGEPIDGITCRTSSDQAISKHTHQLLSIYVNGNRVRVPAGVGIPAPQLKEHLAQGLFIDNGITGCLYWLHVHTNDGVIHVESPNNQTFTLGQFFDIWRQPLGPDQVGPAKGRVVAFVNGKRFVGDPRSIPLSRHAVIQLDVGDPVVGFQPVVFNVNGLCGGGTRGCAS